MIRELFKKSNNRMKLENTGERHIIDEDFTDLASYYIHLLHIASYEYALRFAENKRVLDYGCGSGYGAHMLAAQAESVLAVDISKDAVLYAKDKFEANNLSFEEIKNADFQKYDIITSFQVIEHVTNDKEYLKKLKSMLTPGGILFITTPDRTGRLFKFQNSWNIYHLKEYSANTMKKLISKYFDDFEILHITAARELVLPEIIRRRKQKLITLPATLFFYPHFLRIFLLNFQAKLYRFVSRLLRRKKKHTLSAMNDKKNSVFAKYTSSDINFLEFSELSTDLFVICKNR